MVKFKHVITLIFMGLTVLTSIPAAAQNASNEREAVVETVKAYLHGGTYGNMENFNRAFYSEAEVMYVKNGKYYVWNLEEYLKNYNPGEKLDRQTAILNIDVTGTAAFAKVEAVYDTHRFVDYLSLLKINGKWQIVNKIFYRENF